jgi:carbonic anhydrase
MESLYDRLLAENERWAAAFDRSRLTAPPTLGLAVIACMDARITVEDMLGLRSGDAHIIRNAGGLATADAIRSLVVSQQLLGTSEVLVIGHTRCGMLSLAEDEVRARLAAESGVPVDLPLLAFDDLADNVRRQLGLIRSHPWLRRDAPVHGLIYDVETGRLHPVE